MKPALSIWRKDRQAQSFARVLVLAAGVLLVLDSAGTLQLGFTLTLSYSCLAMACVVGHASVLRGWRATPVWLQSAAAGLIVVYVVATLAGDQQLLTSSTRGGSFRGAIYVVDLILGLSVLGLVRDLWQERSPRPLIGAIVIGATITGAYAVYQWFALRNGWPLADINNAPDSNLLSDAESQGRGLFGGERVRGTFLEPNFLGAYLGSTFPLAVYMVVRARHRISRYMAGLGTLCMLIALVLTASAPAWGVLLLVLLTCTTVLAIARAWVLRAAVIGAATFLAWFAVVPVLASPEILSSLTTRPQSDVAITTGVRTRAWSTAVAVWSSAPVVGHGAGQSSIRIAQAVANTKSPPTLMSAQSVAAAALVDAGLLGLMCWMLLWVGSIGSGIRSLLNRPTLRTWALAASGLAAILTTLTAADRVFPRQWLMIAAMLGASSRPSTKKFRQCRHH